MTWINTSEVKEKQPHLLSLILSYDRNRSLVRQWKRCTNGFTNAQLRQRFHQYDVGGDGKLNHIEFQRLLKCLGISLRGSELDALMSRFDADNDGSIDMHEFFAFMESEVVQLLSDSQLEADHLQNSSSNSNNNIIKKGNLQIPQHRRSTRTLTFSSTQPLAASSILIITRDGASRSRIRIRGRQATPLHPTSDRTETDPQLLQLVAPLGRMGVSVLVETASAVSTEAETEMMM